MFAKQAMYIKSSQKQMERHMVCAYQTSVITALIHRKLTLLNAALYLIAVYAQSYLILQVWMSVSSATLAIF